MRRCGWMTGVVLSILLACALPCQGGVTARISTEQPEDHSLTRALYRFAQLVAKRSNGLVLFAVHAEGRLYTDNEVPRMVSLGRVDMAVPACNMLEPFDPAFSVLALPSFFDSPCDPGTLHDGLLGRTLSASLEKRLDVVVPGRFLTHGAPMLFGVGGKLASFYGLEGRLIRSSGGQGNLLRLAHFGAQALTTPMSDLAQLLRDGRVQGLLATPELVGRMRLWRYGVTDGIDVEHCQPGYVPIVSRQFWGRLTTPMRDLVRACWEEVVPDQRREAREARARARLVLAEQGIGLRRPPEEALSQVRRELSAAEDAMAARLGLDPALLHLAREAARTCGEDGR